MNAREKLAALLELVPTFSDVTLTTVSDVDEGDMVAARGATIELTRAELAQLADPSDEAAAQTNADREVKVLIREADALKARIATLVQSEARAVAGEKAACAALAAKYGEPVVWAIVSENGGILHTVSGGAARAQQVADECAGKHCGPNTNVVPLCAPLVVAHAPTDRPPPNTEVPADSIHGPGGTGC